MIHKRYLDLPMWLHLVFVRIPSGYLGAWLAFTIRCMSAAVVVLTIPVLLLDLDEAILLVCLIPTGAISFFYGIGFLYAAMTGRIPRILPVAPERRNNEMATHRRSKLNPDGGSSI